MLSTGRKDSNAALQTQCCVNQGRSTLRCPLLKVVLLGQVQARQPHHEIGSDPPGCPRLTQAAICSPNQTLSFQKEKSQKCYLTPQNKTKQNKNPRAWPAFITVYSPGYPAVCGYLFQCSAKFKIQGHMCELVKPWSYGATSSKENYCLLN
jgi:hypothetical protein